MYFKSFFSYFGLHYEAAEDFLIHLALYVFMAECIGSIFYIHKLKMIYKNYNLLFKLILILFIFASLFFALLIE